MIYEVTRPSVAELEYAIPSLVGPQGPQGEPGVNATGAVYVIFEGNVNPSEVPVFAATDACVLTYIVGLRSASASLAEGTVAIQVRSGVTVLDSQSFAFSNDADFTAFLIRPMRVAAGNTVRATLTISDASTGYRLHIIGFNQ
jgi:hypothetical protein